MKVKKTEKILHYNMLYCKISIKNFNCYKEAAMKILKKSFIFVCILSLLLTSICSNGVQTTQARELGKTFVDNQNLMEDTKAKVALKNFPKIWTGNYDGNNSKQTVNRKYALKIESVNEETGDFTGIGYVDKGNSKPQDQVKAIYNCKGHIDIKTNTISWQGTNFIDDPGDFGFLEFNAHYSKNLRKIDGSTSSRFAPAKVHLTNAKYSDIQTTLGIDTNNFNYDEDTLNYDLANECMELSLLIYGESCDDGAGYYTKAKKTAAAKQALAKKLLFDNFKSQDYVFGCNNETKESVPLAVHLNTSSLKQNDKKDCIRWVSAEKELSDGTKLIYVIVKGTTGSEWYGNFNVASKESEGIYNSKNAGKHYSFESSAKALVQDLDERYKNETNRIKYVVTGHSRGAAVANIVAKKLTDKKSLDNKENYDSRIEAVYGYTFATPTTVSKTHQGDYKNIFNFCFDDDFVTYMPLADANWQYGRYGTTYCTTAATLNKKYKLFRTIANNYFGQTSDDKWVSYKKNGAYNITKYLTSKCDSVEDFYKKDKYIGVTEKGSWYNFFHETFAALMAKDEADYSFLLNPDFLDVFVKFGIGAIGYITNSNNFQAYIGNTHDAGSYYALTQLLKYKENADSELVRVEKSKLRNTLAAAYPASDIADQALKFKTQTSLTTTTENLYNEEQVNALKTFADTDNNLSLLGWDLDAPSTWNEIKWDSDGNVISIDFDSIGLSGKLDLSSFTALDTLECTNNKLSDLILPEKENLDMYCDGNYLSMNPKEDLYKKLSHYADNGSNVSFSNQSVPENAKFNTTELTKLKQFANADNNLEILGWDIDNPASYTGIQWILINGTYYVDKINLSDLQLSGNVDLSKFAYIKEIDLSNNNITEINVAKCNLLENLNVSSNKITKLDISNISNLKTLFCSNNYLVDNLNDDIISLISQDSDVVIEAYPQYTNASAQNFDENELNLLKEAIGNDVTDIDWEYPGLCSYFQWTKIDNTYFLKSLNLTGTQVSGDIDLSEFKKLTKVNFLRTNIKSVTLPSSTTELDDYAFAYCPNLTSVSVTDSWTSMGTNVFYESPNVSLSCTRNTFAEFIANALDIPFNEIVALAYLEVDGNATEHYLQGENFDLKGAELKVYYSDETTKNITDGYVVTGYDANKLGKQTVTLSYSEDNYTKSTTLDIIVYGHTDNGLLYLFTDNKESEIQIAGYIGEDENVTIPSKINDLNVVKVADSAFEGNKTVSHITISDSITELGNQSFKGCVNLKSFDFGNNLKEIGTAAFSECSSLENANMPDSITGLGNYIFKNCTSLNKAHINEGRINIMEGMFYGCENLEEVNIPDTVENIRTSAFNGCKSLSKIELPESVKLIESSAFKNCSSLQKFEFSSSLSEIGNYAFDGCISLEEAIMPDSITSLGESIFANCSSLKKVHINEGRINITYGLFENCSSLQDINIPDSVQNIRTKAFYGCASLNSLTLPKSLKIIESNVFDGTALNSLEFTGTEEQLKLIDIIATGNEVILANSIKTLADGKDVVLNPKANDDTTTISTVSPSPKPLTPAKDDTTTISTASPSPKPLAPANDDTTTISTTSPSPKPLAPAKEKNNTNFSSNTGVRNESPSKINTPGKITGLKIKNKKKKKAVISWALKTEVSGYQIQYALDRKFTKKKKSTFVGNWQTSKKTILNLRKSKTYYLRVRGYKWSLGKKTYGKWSTIKKIKIKK